MKRLAFLFLLLWAGVAYGATIDTLPPNQWYQVPSSHLATVGYSPSPGGTLGGIMAAWSGGAWDSTRDRLIIWGGGHGDYAGNEIYIFEAVTLAWSRLNNPSTNVGGTESSGVYPDGLPRSRHTYDYILYVPSIDRFCSFGGAGMYPSGQTSTNRTDCFNFFNLTWERKADIPNGGGTTVEAVYDSGTGLVWVNGGSAGILASWNPLTDTWTTRSASDNFMQSFTIMGAIDSTRHKYFATGGGVLWTWDLTAGGNIPRVVQTSSGNQTVQNCTEPGFVYVPPQDKFYGWCGSDPLHLYTLHPTTLVWTQVTPAAGNTVTPTNGTATGTFGRFQYIPSHGAFIVVNSIDEAVYIYKLASAGTLNVGTLVHDGPATPEQLSLFLPITGSLSQNATATVRYKPSASSTWTTGHPLFRIQPSASDTPNIGTVANAFAWPLIDLTPATSYDVEVTVTDGGVFDIKTASMTTRAITAACGPANKTITAGSSASTIQTALNGLVAGDVLQFAAGTYNLSANLQLNNSGTVGNPICIRGISRAGVILQNSGRVWQILGASNWILENMTIQGSGVDSGTAASSLGIQFHDGSTGRSNVTIRNITMTGVDSAIAALNEVSSVLIYNNTLTGNDLWTVPFIDTNITWNDDGINVPGTGNAIFNNTITGFGDSISYAQHSGGANLTVTNGMHVYRNEIRNGGDDGTEADYAIRNNTFYDNRLTNTMTFLSLDPLFGGPFLAARNISINSGRVPFKWNSGNSGQFVYNNTLIRTQGKNGVDGATSAEAGWYQANNGSQNYFGYRNNILVYQGQGTQTIRLDNPTYSNVDWSYNSWYPDATWQWPEVTRSSLAAIYSALPATTPVFTSFSQRHQNDNITIINPWTTTITLGANYRSEIVTQYTPTLANGTAPKNSGVAIANITDGFSGASPDRGAIIGGRAVPTFGDTSALSGLFIDINLSVNCTSGNYSIANRNCTGSDGNGYKSTYADAKIPVEAAVAGDTVYLRAGTYDLRIGGGLSDGPQSFPRMNMNSGTGEGSRITFAGYPGETVWLLPTTDTGIGVLNAAVNSAYITFDRINVDATHVVNGESGVSTNGTNSYITYSNCEIKNANSWQGFSGSGASGLLNGGSFTLVRNCNIHNNGTALDTGGGGYSVYNHGTDSTFENNLFHDNVGYGIQNYGSGHTDISNNVIRYNQVYNNAFGSMITTGGIVLTSGTNNQVYGNLVYNNNGAGIDVYNCVNCIVYNNTVVSNRDQGLKIQTTSPGALVRNNISVNNNTGSGGTANLDDTGPSTTKSNNLCFGTGGTTSCNLTSDPLFVNAGSNDYRLQAGSPAIAAGANLTATVPVDLAGHTWTVPMGIGAYQFVGTPPPGTPILVKLSSTLKLGSGTSLNIGNAQ